MSSFVRNMLKDSAKQDTNRRGAGLGGGRTSPSKSYCDGRVVVGKAIVHKIRTEIGYIEARDIIRKKYRTANGNTFTRIVNEEDFAGFGYDLITKFAETLGIDPNFEIAKYVIAKRPEIVEVVK